MLINNIMTEINNTKHRIPYMTITTNHKTSYKDICLCTLNVASLKTQSLSTSKKISYIHSVKTYIICLQETHSENTTANILRTKFNPHFSV